MFIINWINLAWSCPVKPTNCIHVGKCKTLPLMTFITKKSALFTYCCVFEFISFNQQLLVIMKGCVGKTIGKCNIFFRFLGIFRFSCL